MKERQLKSGTPLPPTSVDARCALSPCYLTLEHVLFYQESQGLLDRRWSLSHPYSNGQSLDLAI